MSEPIEKRDVSDEEREKLAAQHKSLEDGSFPIASEGDLKNAIQAVGRAKDYEKAKRHIVSRAKEMGKTDLLPEDWMSKEADDLPDESANDGDFAIHMEIVKAFPCRKIDRRGREYRLIKSMVMSPGKIDLQDDWTDADEIQDAIHEFMIRLQDVEKSEGESGLSYRHSRMVKSEEARIVECAQLDFPEVWGNRTFPAGTWKIGVRVYSKELFEDIDNGVLRGCSVEGDAIHTKQPLP